MSIFPDYQLNNLSAKIFLNPTFDMTEIKKPTDPEILFENPNNYLIQ